MIPRREIVSSGWASAWAGAWAGAWAAGIEGAGNGEKAGDIVSL